MPKPRIIQNYLFTNEKCSFCKTTAKFAFVNGNFCCESVVVKCPEIKRKNSIGYKDVKRNHGRKGKNQYTKAKELNLPFPEISNETRNKMRISSTGRFHSQETKEKLSKIKIDFLSKNPDKVPYILNHHSKGSSYAEKYFEEIFDKHQVQYLREKREGLYSLDFTFPNTKIDLEINGDQHYLDSRIKNSDIKRRKYLINLGYEIIEVKWSSYQKLLLKDKKEFILNLIQKINGGQDGTRTHDV